MFVVCFIVCRVLSIGHTTNSKFAVCHDKNTRLKKNTRQIHILPCAFFGTRQIHTLPCAFSLAHSKRVIFFLLLPQNFFYSLHITCVTSYLNLVHFCICFLYLTKSFHFKQFFELSQIWTESDSKSRVKLSGKMKFMLFNPIWDHTHQMKRNFEHIVHETQPRTCVRIV